MVREKMNDKIRALLNVCGMPNEDLMDIYLDTNKSFYMQNFAISIIKSCLEEIDNYPIPVGNSPAGELAAEWTYTALEQIRDTIKETFEITDECANS